MGNQRFRFGKFQFEFFTQEHSNRLFDLLRLCLWTHESKEEIVGIATITETAVIRVIRISCRQSSKLLSQLLDLLLFPSLVKIVGTPDQSSVSWICSFLVTFGVFRNENRFDVLIQFIEQNV